MPLSDLLTRHRDLILADLDAAHDYYANTNAAWQIVQEYIDNGGTVTVKNYATGNVSTHQDLPGKALQYVTGYLATATFQQFVSLFEDFVFGVLRHWLVAHPGRLERKQIPMSVVIAATDLAEVKLAAVNRELNELNYKKVREWFAYLEEMAKLGRPSPDEIEQLAEIKATRDVFVHNRGVANLTYEEKAGQKKRGNNGDQLDIPEQYHRESWELIKKVVEEVSAAAIAKA